MTATTTASVKQFYKEMFGGNCPQLGSFLDDQNNTDIGHFNVFDIAELYKSKSCTGKPVMPYNRRTYYKISLIKGKNVAEYADKVINIDDYAILFASPKIPYRYVPQDTKQAGHFCIFTKDFLVKSKTGLMIDELPVFKPNGQFIYKISAAQFKQIEGVFKKMHEEIASDYAFKYDLLRNYVIELIHNGQKLTPLESADSSHNASARISTLFIELLERQFPIESTTQSIRLKTPADFAMGLGIHVNHLNKVLKDITGKTTSEIISSRIVQEAKVLLKQTLWNVSEIAYSLGFEEVAHFSNFFKKSTRQSPLLYRG
jgi:AraC family transcriptional activator of pobA